MDNNGYIFLENIKMFTENNKIFNLLFTFIVFLISNITYIIINSTVYLGLLYHTYNKSHEKMYHLIESKNFPNRSYKTGKVISWNIHYGTNSSEHSNLDKMIEFLNEQDAHIIILQEMVTLKNLDLVELLVKKLNMLDCLFIKEIKLGNYILGKLILSKTKFTKNNVLEYEKCIMGNCHNVLMPTIKIYRQEFLLCNIHLNSDLTGYSQNEHIKLLLKELEKSKYNGLVKVICGDFNMLPFWQIRKDIKKNYDEFVNDKYTYPSNYPIIKLDYAFISRNNNLNNYNLEVLDCKLSDHKPICFYLY